MVKVMPLPEISEKEFLKDLRRPTLSRIRMEYMSFDGTVTMLLRVAALQTPCDDRWILRRPQNPSLFLASLSEFEDEIHFKGGRFVTSQIFNLECYTLDHHAYLIFLHFGRS